MEKFVCVRIVQANGMDLSQLAFDYDLTFAVLMMNADGTVYGRFGTRSDVKEATRDISMEGFAKALEGALALHQQYPLNKAALRGKRGPAPAFNSPEEYPSLRRYKSSLDYEGKVAQSCIHCHQVRDAERMLLREAHQAIPDEVLYPWPMPDVVGLKLDAKAKATVVGVLHGSAAEKAGFQPGDELLTLGGQPLLSIADVQWVLHNARDRDELKAEVRRGERTVMLATALQNGWRRRGDISWRPTTWNLRRMGTGGLVLEDLSDETRRAANLPVDQLALYVKHVGQYGDHAAAKRAGFRQEDIIVDLDGRTNRMTESDFLAYVLQNKMPGQRVDVTVLRSGKRIALKLPMQ